jgi:NitT/TauT family transport system substrate-binding protein
MKKEAVAASINNVELTWQMTPLMIEQTKTYAQQMLELKQIRALPDFATFMNAKFSDEVAHAA